MTTRAASIPRVGRDRRDDRYQAGRPTPIKRASSGQVIAVQPDAETVTVRVLDELLTGVIPLGEMPPVGAICEVEARGDLLVIPLWFEGPLPIVTMTADLPAHNITTVIAGRPPGTTIVGGPEALATNSTDTYVRMSAVEGGAFNVGYDDTTGESRVGFGVWAQPAGTEVTDIRFVAEGYRDGSLNHGNVDEAVYDDIVGPSQTVKPVLYWPFCQVRYGGDPFPSFGGYNLSGFPVNTVGETIAPGMVNLGGYCIAPGVPPQNEKGLAPVVELVVYPWPVVPAALVLTYLAIRITYQNAP